MSGLPRHFFQLKDQVGNKLVSTVQLGVTSGLADYETMVFLCKPNGDWSGSDALDSLTHRYATEAEALAGHGEMVAELMEAMPDAIHTRRV